MNPQKQAFETVMLHAGQETPDPTTGARAPPVYMTTSFVFADCDAAADVFALRKAGNIYSRLTNPTNEAFERRIAALEGATAAIAVASGAAAITYTVENLTRAGDHIVSANTIYGGTYNYFEHTLKSHDIGCTFVDPTLPGTIANFEKAIRDNTKMVFVETIGNPNANLIDIDALAEMCHSHGVPLVVDNTFATPYLFRPLDHGADICIESATKFIGGHGLVLGGVVAENGKFDWEASGRFPWMVEPDPSYHGISFARDAPGAAFCTRIRAIILRDMGACISPVSSFALMEGLETLSLRVERHVYNTERVVEFLANHPKVEVVHHPMLEDSPDHALYGRYFPNGAGSIFTFEAKGGKEGAKRFADSLRMFSLLANVADMKSLVIHPASTTHSQMTEEELLASGIKPSTIRLSIGCENVRDIIADLSQALDRI
ncbi:MAG: O-acetylhomoserine aminocarboxypropyltransferase/cysteine synthase [Thermoplasmata archaeon]|nr:O-acetylhomoserine aminocarboxypropyltransferase/cysteine synthase [Thermoplasmata archaeon]